MPSTVYIGGKAHRLSAASVVGQGGEAVVYRYPPDEVLKVYFKPDDPAFASDPAAQQGARQRLEEHQHKLPAFPSNLPAHVVTPHLLAYDKATKGSIVGYTMPYLDQLDVLLSYADRKWREQGNIDANQATTVFRNLHQLVGQVHTAGVVIGDFNDLNVLVTASGEVYLVDADSMQFDKFLCHTFTTRFVDPLHCDPNELRPIRPHDVQTDWYAFTTMLFQSLLYINPYGGVHKPKNGGKRLRDAARVLKRVTVFSPDVVYPGAAIPYAALPDDLLEYFTQVYEQNKRDVFPPSLLGNLRWTTCTSCGIMHARAICPACAAPGAVKQVITVRGNVTATRLFRTSGQILFATHQGGELRYVYHESGAYKREGDVLVLRGGLDRELRLRIQGDKTVFGKGTTLIALAADGSQSRYDTQLVGRLPVFAANGRHLYWVSGNQLVHDAPLAPLPIGEVLPNRTLVWAGEHFGFGFFRAGSLTRGFVFDARRPGINDSVPLPPMTGNLIDATCTFSDHLAWFMVTIQQGKDILNHCYVISDTGQLLAHAESVQGDGTWLGDSIRGRMARGTQLFAATDAGIVRIGLDGDRLQLEREYPDTEPFVTTDTQLFPAREGIVAVSSKEIVLLQIR
ncbi:MAG TPA: hypothetical protein VLF91_04635 [Candidatus Saccharimonadales bacterium]|nr:hypothetical protein [Candidatus Saccharimonadales bacterium]